MSVVHHSVIHHQSTTGSSHVPAPKSHSTAKSTDTDSSVILFSAAPSVVQTGLQTLAGPTTISAGQKVHTHARPDGTLVYCIKLTVDGAATTYAVDATGAAVTKPAPPPPRVPASDAPESSDDSTTAPPAQISRPAATTPSDDSDDSDTQNRPPQGRPQRPLQPLPPPPRASQDPSPIAPSGQKHLPPPPPQDDDFSSDSDSSAS